MRARQWTTWIYIHANGSGGSITQSTIWRMCTTFRLDNDVVFADDVFILILLAARIRQRLHNVARASYMNLLRARAKKKKREKKTKLHGLMAKQNVAFVLYVPVMTAAKVTKMQSIVWSNLLWLRCVRSFDVCLTHRTAVALIHDAMQALQLAIHHREICIIKSLRKYFN